MGVQVQVTNCSIKKLVPSITIFSMVQLWQVLTKCAPSLTFPCILKPDAHLEKHSTADTCILKRKANCFSINRLHHRRLYPKARNLTLNETKQDTLNRCLSGFKSTPSKYHAKFWRWRHNYDADVFIVTPEKSMKNFKYCAISLNMLHTVGLWELLRFTAHLSFYMSNL